MLSEAMKKTLMLLNDINVVKEDTVTYVKRSEYEVYKDNEAVYVKIPFLIKKEEEYDTASNTK